MRSSYPRQGSQVTREADVSAILALPDADLALLAKVARELPRPKLRARLAGSVEVDTGRGHTLEPTGASDYARGLLLGALDALGRTK